MSYWISRIARSIGLIVFFSIFLLRIDFRDLLDITNALVACAQAGAAGIISWLFSFILADALLRVIAENTHTHDTDIFEDGILQRLYQYRRNEENTVKKVAPDTNKSAGHNRQS
jgi:hypothetical protein